VDDAGSGQAADDPDVAVQPDVTSDQPIAPLQEHSVGGQHTESDNQKAEAASSDQSEATTQPPPDPVAELLSGTDDELIAAIQQAQAEADAAAALERWSQRQNELQQIRDTARARIGELRPRRMELLAELLLRKKQVLRSEDAAPL